MKRNYQTIREEILESFDGSKKTINEIAKLIHADWRTVRHHLEWLEGNKKVEMVWKNKRLKLYKLLQGWL